MADYNFLHAYIESLSEAERAHYSHGSLDYGYMLHQGISKAELKTLQSQYELTLPQELLDFYLFSYGALLNEIELLTIPEIARHRSELENVGDLQNSSEIIPFAYVRGVGDLFAFDMQEEKDGLLLILDGFHEYPIDQWEGICYGFHNWLTKMMQSDFQSFWLK